MSGGIKVPVEETGDIVGTIVIVEGGENVHLERVVICDDTGDIPVVKTTTPSAGDSALVVRNIPSGTQNVSLASSEVSLAAGSNVVGKVALVDSDGDPIGPVTPYQLVNTGASADASVVKASAGKLYGWSVSYLNPGTDIPAAVVVKIYDKATTPTVGSNTPKLTIVVPGLQDGAAVEYHAMEGINFDNGIGVAITNAIAVSDANYPTVADSVVVNLLYR